MQVAIPAFHNPHMIFAAMRKVEDIEKSDTGGCYKRVWMIGTRLVLKRTDMRSAWKELYPQLYSPLARQVIEPYRAWLTGGSDHVRCAPQWRTVYLLQRRLQQDPYYHQVKSDVRHTKFLYQHGMRGKDVGFDRYEGHRNAGITKHGTYKVIDFGCGEWDCDEAQLVDGHIVADTDMFPQEWEMGWQP